MSSFTHHCHYNSLLLLFLFLLFIGQCHVPVSASRPVTTTSTTLVARLKLDDETTTTCWDTLIQLHACTGEIILFFVNGETYIGRSCCQAIRTITHSCWPSMMDSLGFTTEEGDILDTYCSRNTSSSDSPAASVTLDG
ncbi:Egg cell-secreted protein 1.1 [Linum perenne]